VTAIVEIPRDAVRGRGRDAVQARRPEAGVVDLHGKARPIEFAARERDFALDRDVGAGFAIEMDRPQLTDRVVGTATRTEQGVTDPEGEWTRGMVGALKEALVETVAAAGAIACVIDSLRGPVVRTHWG